MNQRYAVFFLVKDDGDLPTTFSQKKMFFFFENIFKNFPKNFQKFFENFLKFIFLFFGITIF